MQNELKNKIKTPEYFEKYFPSFTHELQNPIDLAQKNAELIEKEPYAHGRNLELARQIVRSMAWAQQMLQDALDLYLMDTGQSDFSTKSPCDIIKILNSITDGFSYTYGRNQFLISGPESIRGYWNEAGLKRMFEILLFNSIKNGDSRFPISIRLEKFQDYIEIFIHNWGNHVSQPQLAQPSTHTNTQPNGWQLGLDLVHAITAQMNGEFRITCDPKMGVTLNVCLPIGS